MEQLFELTGSDFLVEASVDKFWKQMLKITFLNQGMSCSGNVRGQFPSEQPISIYRAQGWC